MSNSPSNLTASQAARLANCTSRHINNLITRGDLSAKKFDNKYLIEKSEFFRVFPEAHKKEQEDSDVSLKVIINRLESENALLKDISSKKDKEIEFLRNQIEVSNKEKQQLLESINSHTRLLEHKESGSSLDSYRKRKSWTSIFKNKNRN